MTDMSYEEMKLDYEIMKEQNKELIKLCQSQEKRYEEVNPSWKMNVGEKSTTKYFYRQIKEKIYILGSGTGHTDSIDWYRLQVQIYTFEKNKPERIMIAKDICKKISEEKYRQGDRILFYDTGDMIYCEMVPSMIPYITEEKEND